MTQFKTTTVCFDGLVISQLRNKTYTGSKYTLTFPWLAQLYYMCACVCKILNT